MKKYISLFFVLSFLFSFSQKKTKHEPPVNIKNLLASKKYRLIGEFYTIQDKPLLRYAKVLGKNGWGYIDSKGDEVIPAQYDFVHDFNNEGWAKVLYHKTTIDSSGKEQKIYYQNLINSKGKKITQREINKISQLNDSLFMIQIHAGDNKYYWGMVNDKGKEIFQPIYDSFSYDFVNFRFFAFMKNSKFAFFYINGEQLSDYQYNEANFYNKSMFGYIKGKGYERINAETKIIEPVDFDYHHSVHDQVPVKKVKGKDVLIDDYGNIVSEAFDEISIPEHSKSYFVVRKDSKTGLMDKTGKLVIPLNPDYYGIIISESEDIFAVIIKDDQYIYLDKNLHEIPMENLKKRNGFSRITSFNDGVLGFLENGKYGAINLKGEIVIPPVYDQSTFFYDNYAVVFQTINKEDKYGLIDRTGKVHIPFIYDFIDYLKDENFVRIYKKHTSDEDYGRVGFATFDGKIFIQPVYSSLNEIIKNKIYYGKNLEKDTFELIDLQKNTITEMAADKRVEFLYHMENQKSLKKYKVDDTHYGFKDKDGQIVIEPKYFSLGDMVNGLTIAQNQDFKFLLIDTYGNEILLDSIDLPYEDIRYLKNYYDASSEMYYHYKMRKYR